MSAPLPVIPDVLGSFSGRGWRSGCESIFSYAWIIIGYWFGSGPADSNVFTLGGIALVGNASDSSVHGDLEAVPGQGSGSEDFVYPTWTPVPEPSAALLGAAEILLMPRHRVA